MSETFNEDYLNISSLFILNFIFQFLCLTENVGFKKQNKTYVCMNTHTVFSF